MNVIRRLGGSLERTVRRYIRRMLEPFGICIFSKAARHSMDDKLQKYLPEHGVFIEAGAADGYTESNTYYLEKCKGWTGVLIEPIPDLYKKCAAERPRSRVFNCGLVSGNYRGMTVVLKEGDLMSTVEGALGGEEKEHLERAAYFHGTDAKEITVPARTLTSVLKEAGISHIDFFSLDVEGYEKEVLEGLDSNLFRPTYLLVECLDTDKKKEIEQYIGDKYAFIKQLSKRDYLYRSKQE